MAQYSGYPHPSYPPPPPVESTTQYHDHPTAHPPVYPPPPVESKIQYHDHPTAHPPVYPPPPVQSTTQYHDHPTAHPPVYPPVGYPTQHGNNTGNNKPPQGYPLSSYPAPPPVATSSSSSSQQNINNAQYYSPQPNYHAGPSAAAVPAPTPQPNYNAIAKALPVVGPQYCLPHLVDLAVTRKLMTITDDFVVTDVNQNTVFIVKGKFFSLHDKRVLLDSNGKPVLTLRHKILTAHSRWLVYRGGSSESSDLLFTAKTSSVIQLKTKLNVYLGNRGKSDEVVSDFKVHGSWSEGSCVVYVGESKTIAAQMNKKESAASYFLGKDTFMITIYPNVDYAFVVALILILDAINSSDDV